MTTTPSSSTACGASAKSAVATSPETIVTGCETEAWPIWRARTVTAPTGTPSIVKLPSRPVVTPVVTTMGTPDVVTTLTCAPASGSPVALSVTTPVTLPTSWARARWSGIDAISATTSRRFMGRLRRRHTQQPGLGSESRQGDEQPTGTHSWRHLELGQDGSLD